MESTGKRNGMERNAFVNSARRVSIDSLNQQISRQVYSSIQESNGLDADVNKLSETEKAFRKYEEAMEAGITLNIGFDACDKNGSFSMYDNGILVILPGDNVENMSGSANVYSISRMVGLQFSLKIVRVDRDNKRVYCAIPGRTKVQVHNTIKAAIQNELEKLVKNQEVPIVWGKITRVTERRALVDMLGHGVLGMIDTSHWQKCYTRSLIGMCEEGEFYQFEVVKKAPKMEGKSTAWVLSRRNITDNAWDLIDYENLQPGGTILVKCLEKPEGKSYWWGGSDRTPGIEIMCDYTNKYNQESGTLMEGITYKCKIKDIIKKEDHRQNRFTAIPFGVADEDAAKVGAVKQFRKKKEEMLE